MASNKWDDTLPKLGADAVKSATEEELSEALVHATEFLDTLPWKGQKKSKDQERSWPRTGVFDRDGKPIDGVPQEVKHACYEVAGFILAKIPFNATSLAHVFAIAGHLISEQSSEHMPTDPTWH